MKIALAARPMLRGRRGRAYGRPRGNKFFAHVQNLRKISSYVNPMASSSLPSVVETALPEIGESPSQPSDFQFPKRQFGKKDVVSRSFQPSWFKLYPWHIEYPLIQKG